MKTGDKERQDSNLKNCPPKISLTLSLFFLLLIFTAGFVSSVQIEINEQYSQQETFIAKISGNFIDVPTSNNILFYRDHVRKPTNVNILKIQDAYYAYAILNNKEPGNYSMRIENIRYKIGTQTKNDDVIKNFTISGETSDFYVSPGVLKTTDDFSLELTNLRDSSLEVEISYDNSSDASGGFFESFFGGGSSTQTVTLSSGQIKKIDFVFDDSLNQSTLKTITLESENITYEVPAYLEMENKTDDEGVGKLNFESLLLNVSMATDSNTTRVLYLQNKEDFSVENISLYLSDEIEPYINISLTEIKELDENSTIRIDLFISSGADEKTLSGQITARYIGENDEETFAHSTIIINFVEDYVPTYEDEITIEQSKTCSELNGFVCNRTTEICPDGQAVYSSDVTCCLKACEQISKPSSTGRYVGWGLVILVVLFLGWFYMKKFKKVSNPVDLLKAAQAKK